MRRLRHRQFQPLLKTVLRTPVGSGTSAQVWVVFQAKAYNSTPGAGRPATPVGSHLIFRPLLLLVEATKGLCGAESEPSDFLSDYPQGECTWRRPASACRVSQERLSMVAVQSELWSARRDQWTKGSSPSPGTAWLLLETEISQSYISEIFVSCPQLSISISLLILEMTTGHCSQMPQLSSPKQAMVS